MTNRNKKAFFIAPMARYSNASPASTASMYNYVSYFAHFAANKIAYSPSRSHFAHDERSLCKFLRQSAPAIRTQQYVITWYFPLDLADRFALYFLFCGC